MESEGTEFVHCFLVLEWNLMARSEHFVGSHVENLYLIVIAKFFNFQRQNATLQVRIIVTE